MRATRLSVLGFTAATAIISALGVACGSSTNSSMFNDHADTSGSGLGGGGGGSDPFGGGGTGGDGGTGNGNDDGGNTCAATNADAQLTPVNLVVMYDRSGSMGDTNEDPSYDPAKRWNPVGDAMKAFFSAPTSAGLSATLQFFPDASNSCASANYATTQIPLTALPDAIFDTTITATKPKGDTPTFAAVEGAITQAQAIQASHPSDKTVIVLVTDGEPWGCNVNNANQAAEVQRVATKVGTVASTIPTYVIGIGPSVTSLNAVAAAGGTTASFPVQVGNPTQTRDQLIAAMGAIRSLNIRCDFDIPTPPDGRALDFDKVFVQFTPGGQPTTTLPYSADCSDPNGWHFDDAAAPKKVLLCDSTCNAVKNDTAGKINVSFSCADRPDVVK